MADDAADDVVGTADGRRDRPDVVWTGGEPEPFSGNRYLVGHRR